MTLEDLAGYEVTQEDRENFRLRHASPLGGPRVEDYPRLMREVVSDRLRLKNPGKNEQLYDESELVPCQFHQFH